MGCHWLHSGEAPTPTAAVQPPVISEPKVGVSGPLRPGEETGIAVTVSKAAGAILTYTWNVDGKIIKGQGSPAITYRAPDKAGTYKVSVVVNWDDQSVEQATFIKVEVPTPTPTPVPPTDTPVPPTATRMPPTATRMPPTATPVPPTATPTRPLTATPTTPPLGVTLTLTPQPPTVTIEGPRGEVPCPPDPPCRFSVWGEVTGVEADSDYRIIVFVNPGDPDLWWPHPVPSIGIKADGTWEGEAQIGDNKKPEQPGHGFDIVAVVMSVEEAMKVRDTFQELPEGVAKSSYVDLVTAGGTPQPPTPTPTPSPVGCDNFTSLKVIRPPLPLASSGVTGSFSAPQHCETGLPAGKGLSVGGTATNVPKDSFLWLLVYTPDTNYYPQCDNAAAGRCGANLSGGIWAVKTFIGRKGCKEHFHLVLVKMDQTDNDQLTQEMIQRAQSGDWAFERSELPASVEEIASIEVETAGSVCD